MFAKLFLDGRPDEVKAQVSRLEDGRSILDDVRDQAKSLRSGLGVEAGEPFYVREALNVHDPVDLLTRPMNLYS